jgi:hypothetical protein
MNTLVDTARRAFHREGFIVIEMDSGVEIRFPVAKNPRLARGTPASWIASNSPPSACMGPISTKISRSAASTKATSASTSKFTEAMPPKPKTCGVSAARATSEGSSSGALEYRAHVRRKIEAGVADLRAGRTRSHEAIRREFGLRH